MWRQAVKEAARELGVDYTIPERGTALYRAARRNYDCMLANAQSELSDTGTDSDLDN